ncbi:DNA (cytosine-5)-methyltransferase 1 [Sphingobium sp. YG1]|nr:DNA (cytosine-5)-methyltransferase 1 [Sphingobium sp. YG1]
MPSLQLKSGVRFELANNCTGDIVTWGMAFYFGTSKAIHSIPLSEETAGCLDLAASPALKAAVAPCLERIRHFVENADIANMQSVWTHRRPGGTRAFMLLDQLDETGSAMAKVIASHSGEASRLIEAIILHHHGASATALPGLAKLARNSATILAGLLIGSTVNPLLLSHACSGHTQKRRTSI